MFQVIKSIHSEKSPDCLMVRGKYGLTTNEEEQTKIITEHFEI